MYIDESDYLEEGCAACRSIDMCQVIRDKIYDYYVFYIIEVLLVSTVAA